MGERLLDLVADLDQLQAAVSDDLDAHGAGAEGLLNEADGLSNWWEGPQANDARRVLRETGQGSRTAQSKLEGAYEVLSDVRSVAWNVGVELVDLEREQRSLLGNSVLPFATAEEREQAREEFSELTDRIAELVAEWERAERMGGEALQAAAAAVRAIVPAEADFVVGGAPMPTGKALSALHGLVTDVGDLSDEELAALREWIRGLSAEDLAAWAEISPELADYFFIEQHAAGLVVSSTRESISAGIGGTSAKLKSDLKITLEGGFTVQELANGQFAVVMDLGLSGSADLKKLLRGIPATVGLDGKHAHTYTFNSEEEALAFKREMLIALQDVPSVAEVGRELADVTSARLRSILESDGMLDLLGNTLGFSAPVLTIEALQGVYLNGIADVLAKYGDNRTSIKSSLDNSASLNVELTGIGNRELGAIKMGNRRGLWHDIETGRYGLHYQNEGGINLNVAPALNASLNGSMEISVSGAEGKLPDTASVSLTVDAAGAADLHNLFGLDMFDTGLADLVEVTTNHGGRVNVNVSVPTHRVDDLIKATTSGAGAEDLPNIFRDSTAQITVDTYRQDGIEVSGPKGIDVGGSRTETTTRLAIVKGEGTGFRRVK